MESYDIEFDQPHEEYKITNDAEAGWAMRRIKTIREQCNRMVAQCQDRITAYTLAMRTQIETLQRNAEHDEQYMTAMLHAYTDTIDPASFDVSKKTGVKNYRLPEGKIVYKPERRELACNRDVLLAELKRTGLTEYIKVEESPKWADVKKKVIVDEDGHAQIPDADGALAMVDGIAYTTVPAAFEVEVK